MIMLHCVVVRWSNVTVSQAILDLFFPGQLTAVFTRKEGLNVSLNPGTHLIGIRIPDNTFIREVVRACQYPIALTSANKTGSKSTLQIEVSVFILTISNQSTLGVCKAMLACLA